MKDPLFEPIGINRMQVKNRIVMPAMHLGMAENFQVTRRLEAFYAQRARGGAGLICVGYATVDGMSGNTQNIGAHRDDFIPGLRRLATAIQSNGARAAVQLNHAGRYNFSFFLDGRQPVAPSPIASRLTRETPRPLSVEEIDQVVDAFAAAAGRVAEAGFDAVEVLAGTGYLISEFLSPLTNQRKDAYGGSLDNRMRFGLEVVRAVRQRVGEDFPIIVRMNGNDFMPDGQPRAELATVAETLSADGGADALCINVGWHEARVPQIVTVVPRGAFAYLSRAMRERVNVPVIASHRINDPQLARELIDDGLCDMVAVGRGLIADPQWPEKAAAGREDEVVHCVACAQGCFDHLFQLKAVECLCNPMAGHEDDRPVTAAPTARTVMVIGGGPAGMNAALAASRRGHRVTLYEKTGRLGGQLVLAAAPPGRDEFAVLARDLARQIENSAVKVALNCELTAERIDELAPDAVVLATGAEPSVPPVAGIDQSHVVQAWDVLQGKVSTGRRVVVLGGGAVGVETALFLADKGTLPPAAVKFLLVNRAEEPEAIYRMAITGTKQVTLVEMVEAVGRDIGKSTRWEMLQSLSRHGVDLRTETRAVAVTEQGLTVEKGGETEVIAADSIVLAAGSRPYAPLKATLENRQVPFQMVGDAAGVGTAFDAVHQGFLAGCGL